MQVLYTPQRSDQKIKYSFENEKINVEYEGQTGVFDFSSLPDGIYDVEGVTTALTINPIISAKRENGILYVELLDFIGTDASEEERFPSRQKV